ncbi:RNI-like protein [Glarea lozoyensis ATCC 20868]|uniref:RNI-like protein n=1 Tax=Glarea lozoyensis (strain ATCC 20868 / MF5171) TaxID=1116229 RepID=S3D7N8_GLAL2|nr:RNI-like protein [Glarea lozoyensis ATCC 20868]EPE33134.1 RNI-like protein [Glarea lozoyensis ATCC 20868]
MAHPPSYEDAIADVDVVQLVCHYFDDTCLVNSSRVCTKWHSTMNRRLWRDPFAFVASRPHPFRNAMQLIRKIKEIPVERTARTLRFVMALDFRPLLALGNDPAHNESFQHYEMYFSTRTAVMCSTYLPNLRFLYLAGLQVIDRDRPLWQTEDRVDRPRQLLLLDARGVRALNCGLIPQHNAFGNLMFVDLSYTIRPEGFQRIFSGGRFLNLRVLKLRGLKLTDSMLPDIILRSGHRLWSLDIRDNLLTVAGVQQLIDNCLQPLPPQLNDVTSLELVEAAPKYERDITLDHQSQTERLSIACRPDDEASFTRYLNVRGNLLQPLGYVLDEKDDLLKATGLTNLHISGNKLNASAVDIILPYMVHLKVLDVASIRVHPSQSGRKYSYLTTTQNTLPLIQSLGCCTEFLRIHHSAVTGTNTPIFSLSSLKYSLAYLRDAEKAKMAGKQKLFLPRDNYHLRHLTLTDIPTKSFGPVIHRLIDFLNDCVAQERVLRDAAHSVGLRHRRAPKLLSGLHTLRLEFMAEDTGLSNQSVGSASEDHDADGFLRESEKDFSFFDDNQPRSVPVIKEEFVHDVLGTIKRWRKYSIHKWAGKLEIDLPHG